MMDGIEGGAGVSLFREVAAAARWNEPLCINPPEQCPFADVAVRHL